MPSLRTQIQAAHDALLSRDLLEGLYPTPTTPDHIRNIAELAHPSFLEVKARLDSKKITHPQAAYLVIKLYYGLLDDLCPLSE